MANELKLVRSYTIMLNEVESKATCFNLLAQLPFSRSSQLYGSSCWNDKGKFFKLCVSLWNLKQDIRSKAYKIWSFTAMTMNNRIIESTKEQDKEGKRDERKKRAIKKCKEEREKEE